MTEQKQWQLLICDFFIVSEMKLYLFWIKKIFKEYVNKPSKKTLISCQKLRWKPSIVQNRFTKNNFLVLYIFCDSFILHFICHPHGKECYFCCKQIRVVLFLKSKICFLEKLLQYTNFELSPSPYSFFQLRISSSKYLVKTSGHENLLEASEILSNNCVVFA